MTYTIVKQIGVNTVSEYILQNGGGFVVATNMAIKFPTVEPARRYAATIKPNKDEKIFVKGPKGAYYKPYKTELEYQIHGLYNGQWEEVTAEVTYQAARQTLRDYRENEPGIPFKIVSKRIKITN